MIVQSHIAQHKGGGSREAQDGGALDGTASLGRGTSSFARKASAKGV